MAPQQLHQPRSRQDQCDQNVPARIDDARRQGQDGLFGPSRAQMNERLENGQKKGSDLRVQEGDQKSGAESAALFVGIPGCGFAGRRFPDADETEPQPDQQRDPGVGQRRLDGGVRRQRDGQSRHHEPRIDQNAEPVSESGENALPLSTRHRVPDDDREAGAGRNGAHGADQGDLEPGNQVHRFSPQTKRGFPMKCPIPKSIFPIRFRIGP